MGCVFRTRPFSFPSLFGCRLVAVWLPYARFACLKAVIWSSHTDARLRPNPAGGGFVFEWPVPCSQAQRLATDRRHGRHSAKCLTEHLRACSRRPGSSEPVAGIERSRRSSRGNAARRSRPIGHLQESARIAPGRRGAGRRTRPRSLGLLQSSNAGRVIRCTAGACGARRAQRPRPYRH